MKLKYVSLLVTVALLSCLSSKAQTPASQSTFAAYDQYTTQINGDETAFISWFVPTDPLNDMVSLTDGQNGGAPLNAYLGTGLYIDRTSGATIKIDTTLLSYPAANITGFSSAAIAAVTWSTLTGKPSFAAVATSGAYTDLSGRPSLAAVATTGLYSDLTGRPSLATVATTGAYSDLTGKPSLATVATSGAYADLTGKPSLATVATSGSYTDLTNLPPARSFNNAPSHTIQTVAASANGFQVSALRDSSVSYSVTLTTTATIGGASSGYVVLEICSTNSSTAGNWIEIGRVSNGQTITLALTLQSAQVSGGCVAGIVPAGYYARLRSVNVSGTPTYAFNSGQEVLL